jgi:hypothetical protein
MSPGPGPSREAILPSTLSSQDARVMKREATEAGGGSCGYTGSGQATARRSRIRGAAKGEKARQSGGLNMGVLRVGDSGGCGGHGSGLAQATWQQRVGESVGRMESAVADKKEWREERRSERRRASSLAWMGWEGRLRRDGWMGWLGWLIWAREKMSWIDQRKSL